MAARGLVTAVLVAAPLAVCGLARSAEVDGSVLVGGIGQSVPDGLFRAQLRLADAPRDRAERLALWLNGRAHVEARPTPRVGLRVGVDTGLLEVTDEGAFLDGRDPADQAQRTLLLGETWAEGQLLTDGALLLRVGKFRADVGDHAVFSAYGLGLLADLDLSLVEGQAPWRVRVQALFPSAALVAETFRSPLLDLEVGYRFGRLGEVRAVGAIYVDRGAVGPVLSDALVRGQAEAVLDAFARAEARLDDNPCDPSDDAARGPTLVERLSCLRDTLVDDVNAGRFRYAADTRGLLGWAGLSGRARVADLSLRATLLYGFGAVDATFAPDGASAEAVRTRFETLKATFPRRADEIDARRARFEANARRSASLSLSSWLLQLRADYDIGARFALDGFVVALSGDDGLPARVDEADPTYRSFVSLAPRLPYTTLFFQGPALPVRSTPVAASVAPDGAGLVAGGLGGQAFVGDRYRVRAGVAAMSALVSESVGAFQGVEVDVTADAIATEWLLLAVDAALFVPGPYFGDAPLGYQGLLTARARWP